MRLLTTAEVADMLQMSERWVVESGPPPIMLGNRKRYRTEDIEAWLEAKRPDSTKTPAQGSGNSESRSKTPQESGGRSSDPRVSEIAAELSGSLRNSERKSKQTPRGRGGSETKKAG